MLHLRPNECSMTCGYYWLLGLIWLCYGLIFLISGLGLILFDLLVFLLVWVVFVLIIGFWISMEPYFLYLPCMNHGNAISNNKQPFLLQLEFRFSEKIEPVAWNCASLANLRIPRVRSKRFWLEVCVCCLVKSQSLCLSSFYSVSKENKQW